MISPQRKSVTLSSNQVAPQFIQKTYALMTEAPAHIAQWSNHGSTILIHDPYAFSRDLLPQYFRHSNFLSFVRQLNFYGFRKCKRDDPTSLAWEFEHEAFLQDEPELMHTIRRHNQPMADQDTEPEPETTPVAELRERISTVQTNFELLTQQLTQLTAVISTLVVSRKRSVESDSGGAKRLCVDADADDMEPLYLDRHSTDLTAEDLAMVDDVLDILSHAAVNPPLDTAIEV
ncbi:hypothetical protein SPRG_19168 [Saprolegnia parasitica CBS 223.65]|uniref:HSF-type DNA-binding domain-containing protein n=1 Tax=Saprolegnia parasitica (strain CBS 223.65) TaxID=695850 RepID=A0A067CW97_SAPPC|nr:hypothetical protein SPRG_19168 [Saprolegnia parasitica CBS 223.65]KDO33535.1 hypothetical protein SPRG_19168 [Saprolegnia parasitica CBS 223.65]|eukprot:XP_012195595.1 hypothetical protein SPRG_19168 [Saprolegnia parasitica CBS 223.65]